MAAVIGTRIAMILCPMRVLMILVGMKLEIYLKSNSEKTDRV